MVLGLGEIKMVHDLVEMMELVDTDPAYHARALLDSAAMVDIYGPEDAEFREGVYRAETAHVSGSTERMTLSHRRKGDEG